MKIRVGDFGGKIAPAVEGPGLDLRRRQIVRTEGLSEQLVLADREAERERKINEEQARRNRAASTFASYQVDAEELSSGIGTRLTEGLVTRDDAQKELDDGIAGLKKKHLEPLDPVSRATLSDNVILFDGRARGKFREALQKHAFQERGAAFESTVESLQRLAVTDMASATRQAEMLFGGEGVALMGAQKAGAAHQRFKEGVIYTDAYRRIGQAQNDRAGLQAISGELDGDAYADMDPQKREFLKSSIGRSIVTLDHKAEVAERKRLNDLERREKRLSWYVENGQQIPPAEFDRFVRDAKGTEFEGAAEGILGTQKALTEMSRKTPTEMVRSLRELETQYGDTPSKEQLIHLGKVRRFVETSIKLGNESPLTYARERDGAQVEPLNINDPLSWGPNLAARTAILTEQSRRTGFAPKGLLPQEAAELSFYLRGVAKPEDKRQALAALRQGFGDDQVFKATMMQIAPDDPVTAAAGLAAARGLESTPQRYLADEILRGQQLLRPNRKEDGSPAGGKVLPMPSDADFMKVWATNAGNAFAGNAEAGNIFFQSARAIYAARADRDGDQSGVMNPRRWQEAIEAATGGGFQTYNRRTIVLPYNMSAADFKDGMRSRADWLIAQGRVDKGWNRGSLLDLPLQHEGDGRYSFAVGDGALGDRQGKKIILDFNESAPFSTSGADGADRGPVTKKGRSNPQGR